MKTKNSPQRRESAEAELGCYRPCVERMTWLAAKLRQGEPVNASKAARRFEISTKTAFRDLEFLRDRLGYEVEWVAQQHTYRLVSAPEPVL